MNNQMMQTNGQMTNVDIFRGVINDRSIRNRIKACLGDHAGAFTSSMLDLYSGDRYLQNCDPQAVAMECLKAASLNLPINKGLGFAYVVPYKNVPTFMVGWKGLIQLAQRSGQYRTINADVIYEGEEIQKNRLTGEFSIGGQQKSDEVVGYFGYFELINGYKKMLYMSREEVEAYGRKYSKAFNNGPWKTEFDKMAMKTVLRQLLKYGPMSTEMQRVDEYETLTAQAQAQATVDANANKVPLDLPAQDADIIVDESTGEVTGTIPVAPDVPDAPGF